MTRVTSEPIGADWTAPTCTPPYFVAYSPSRTDRVVLPSEPATDASLAPPGSDPWVGYRQNYWLGPNISVIAVYFPLVPACEDLQSGTPLAEVSLGTYRYGDDLYSWTDLGASPDALLAIKIADADQAKVAATFSTHEAKVFANLKCTNGARTVTLCAPPQARIDTTPPTCVLKKLVLGEGMHPEAQRQNDRLRVTIGGHALHDKETGIGWVDFFLEETSPSGYVNVTALPKYTLSGLPPTVSVLRGLTL